MNQNISERVYVSLDNNSKPIDIKWKNRLYEIKKIGFHHTYKNGETLYHVFSVTTDSLFFKLELNTSNLQWLVKQFYEY